MTNFDFIKEEYATLRKEVEASVSELATLERQSMLATAAIYGWLATAGLKGAVAELAWWIPVMLSLFAALRSAETGRHLRRLSTYICFIEEEVAGTNKYAKGWEHYHNKATVKGLRTKIRITAWIVFLIVTIGIAILNSDIKF